jgi:solute:Na+ symporter, SSS family
VLAAAFFGPELRAMGTNMDFELVLPMALGRLFPWAAGLFDRRPAGGLHVQLCGHGERGAAVFCQRHLQALHQPQCAAPKTYVRLSYLASFAVVVIGVLIGWNVTSVNEVVVWIVSGLWGGYTASNVLKWYWWRFNGYGYFWGMVTGIASALGCRGSCCPAADCAELLAHLFHQHGSGRLSFPMVVGISLIGCLLGTLLTKPETMRC